MLTVFLYHAVSDRATGRSAKWKHDVSLDNFILQLSVLKKKNIPFHSSSLSCTRRQHCLALTFDDGYKSIFLGAIPRCIEMGIPVCVFLTGSLLEGKGFWRDHVRAVLQRGLTGAFVREWNARAQVALPLEPFSFYRASKHHSVNSLEFSAFLREFLAASAPDALEECAALGPAPGDLIHHPLVAYGNHGYGHYVMSSLSAADQEADIRRNDRLIRQTVSPDNISDIFSLPFGGIKDANQDTFRILAEHGYKGVALSRGRTNFSLAQDPMGLLLIERWMPPSDLGAFRRELLMLPAKTVFRSVRDKLRAGFAV